MENCLAKLSTIKNYATKEVFALIFRIYALDIILRDLGFFMTEGVISVKASQNAQITFNDIIKVLA